MDTIEQKWIQSDKIEHNRTEFDTTRQKWKNLIWRQQMNLAYFKIGYRWDVQFYL